MPDLSDAIKILRKEIEDVRSSLKNKENALRVLEEMYAKEAGYAPENTGGAISAEGLIDLSAVQDEKRSSRVTFIDSVRDVISRFGDQEFSVVHTEFAFNKLGIEIPGNTPRSRISAALGKLEKEGFIEITEEGSGNTPNRYRLRRESIATKEEAPGQ